MSYGNNSPIGVFDSGLGGIGVLRELVGTLPTEDFIYFGDSANAPYGEKTAEKVREISDGVVKKLLAMGAKAIVIACNTATSAAADCLREKYSSVPIIGMEPAVKPASLVGEHPTVLVMATPLTLKQPKLRRLIEKYRDRADFIDVPCHGLVELVERGVTDGEEMDSLLHRILDEKTEGRRIDSAVLGCTHYIHAKEAIGRIVGSGVKIFDGADGTAKETKRRLAEAGLLSGSEDKGRVEIFNSANSERMRELSLYLLEK